MTPLKQCDPRWGSKKLGNSNLCNIGCTCTCLAMLAGTTPDKIVDEAQFTSGGAIYWQSLKSLKFIWRGYSYDNAKVLQAIKDYGGCLVEVSMPQAPGGKHWVLFIGDGKMNDPLTGKNENTSKYTPTGYCVLEPLQTTNNDMSDLIKKYGCKTIEELDSKIFEHVGLNWGNADDKDNKSFLASDRRKVKRLEGELEQIKKDKVLLDMDLKKESEKIRDANTKIFNLNETIADLKTTIRQNEDKIKELNGEIKKLKAEGINSDDCTQEFLAQVIGGLEGYGGEMTLEGVLNSLSQREAQRLTFKKELEELKNNPIIKFIQAIKGLIK
jgi:uncharacterized coiled-coil protein SlyX